MAKQTKKQKALVEKLGDNQQLHGIDAAIQTLKDLKRPSSTRPSRSR